MKQFHTPFLTGLLVFLFFATSGQSQQFPIRTTAMMNPFQDHPAMAGVLGCMDLHMGYRNQWSGIEGAPQTSFANLHGQMTAQGQDFHGFGGRVESDEAGSLGVYLGQFCLRVQPEAIHRRAVGNGLQCRVFPTST